MKTPLGLTRHLSLRLRVGAFSVSRLGTSLLCGIACFTFPCLAGAATVTFGAAQNITGDNDVNNSFGVLDRAYNFGLNGVSDTTINGVTFLAAAAGFSQPSTTYGSGDTTTVLTALNGNSNANNGFGSTTGAYAALSPAMRSLLTSSIFYDTAGQTLELSLNGLTVGASYLIQFFVNDSRNNTGTRTDTITGLNSTGNSVVLKYNTIGVDGGLGQFGLATFTADDTTQSFDILGNESAQISGFQLRVSAPVPEPGTIGLLFGGCSMLLVFARNHRCVVIA